MPLQVDCWDLDGQHRAVAVRERQPIASLLLLGLSEQDGGACVLAPSAEAEIRERLLEAVPHGHHAEVVDEILHVLAFLTHAGAAAPSKTVAALLGRLTLTLEQEIAAVRARQWKGRSGPPPGTRKKPPRR